MTIVSAFGTLSKQPFETLKCKGSAQKNIRYCPFILLSFSAVNQAISFIATNFPFVFAIFHLMVFFVGHLRSAFCLNYILSTYFSYFFDSHLLQFYTKVGCQVKGNLLIWVNVCGKSDSNLASILEFLSQTCSAQFCGGAHGAKSILSIHSHSHRCSIFQSMFAFDLHCQPLLICK